VIVYNFDITLYNHMQLYPDLSRVQTRSLAHFTNYISRDLLNGFSLID